MPRWDAAINAAAMIREFKGDGTLMSSANSGGSADSRFEICPLSPKDRHRPAVILDN